MSVGKYDLGNLPSEEEHLLSGGRVKKSTHSLPFLERDADWSRQLSSWLERWQEKTGLYNKQPKAVAMAGRLLGSNLKIPLSHSVKDISGYFKRGYPEASAKERKDAARFVYGLTSSKSEDVEVTTYLGEGLVDNPSRED